MKSIRLVLAALLFFFFKQYIFSQTNQKDTLPKMNKNEIYLELGGSAMIYSLNYERILINDSAWALNARFGLEYYPFFSMGNATYIPVSFYITRKMFRSKLELGVGHTSIFRWRRIIEEKTIFNFDKSKYDNAGTGLIKGHDEPYDHFFHVNIGWHKDFCQNLFIKLRFSPLVAINKYNKFGIIPWGALCIGKTF